MEEGGGRTAGRTKPPLCLCAGVSEPLLRFQNRTVGTNHFSTQPCTVAVYGKGDKSPSEGNHYIPYLKKKSVKSVI